MSDNFPALPSGADIDKAAKLALPLFRLNQWTWRGSPTPPDEADLGAQYSSLAWSLDSDYSGKVVKGPKAEVHFATSGRLMVTRMQSPGENGHVQYIYSVTV